ncbi:hypothetical protein [Streptomyces sp. NPDC007117]|uniref:hypothetical protein n=1 Tax=Streptomyces sp. NPDC007117 TaxID=3154314 RepID=UPI0033D95F13
MAATAMTNATVHIRTEVKGGEPIESTIGTIAVRVQDGMVDVTDVRQALAELLCQAGTYLKAD